MAISIDTLLSLLTLSWTLHTPPSLTGILMYPKRTLKDSNNLNTSNGTLFACIRNLTTVRQVQTTVQYNLRELRRSSSALRPQQNYYDVLEDVCLDFFIVRKHVRYCNVYLPTANYTHVRETWDSMYICC